MNRNDILAINKKLGTNFKPETIAMDAYQGGTAQLVTNGGIPALLTTWLDPSHIDVLVAPMRMAEII